MTRHNVDFGIDLGATKSAIAVMNDGVVELVRNGDNAEFTPSAVQVTGAGRIRVGRRAKERVEDDPDNAKSDFRQNMGVDGARETFTAAGTTMTPTQLSGEVLKSLKQDVERQLGEELDTAVITIPAAFGLHQTEATRQAAELAGIVAPHLLQEPTAAAFAYLHRPDTTTDQTFWLVYDLGGGTFDAAVMRLRDGECTLLAHRADNHLGGARIDWDLVDQVLIPAARRDLGWSDLARGTGADPRWRGAIAKLKAAAETAKIELSHLDSTTVDAQLRHPSGTLEDFEATVTRAELERIAEPYDRRSVELCRHALAAAGVRAQELERALLVGGSTLAPRVGALLADPQQGLGVVVDQRENPVTVIARGAAMFAGSRVRDVSAPRPRASEVTCDLNFDPVSDDPTPLVGGRLQGAVADWTGFAMRFVDPTPGRSWEGPFVPVRPDGGFTAQLLAREGTTTYRIELRDPRGTPVPITPAELTYRLDERVPDNTTVLPQSIGVGLPTGDVTWFFPAGARIGNGLSRMMLLHTTVDLIPGGTGEVLRVPLVQGDQARAARNRQVGLVVITADRVSGDVPPGTPVEVTVEVTASQVLRVTAFVPLLGEDWESEIELVHAAPSVDQLQAAVTEVERRVIDVERRAGSVVEPDARTRLDRLAPNARIADIRRLQAACSSADVDACESRIRELQAALDEVEAIIRTAE